MPTDEIMAGVPFFITIEKVIFKINITIEYKTFALNIYMPRLYRPQKVRLRKSNDLEVGIFIL